MCILKDYCTFSKAVVYSQPRTLKEKRGASWLHAELDAPLLNVMVPFVRLFANEHFLSALGHVDTFGRV